MAEYQGDLSEVAEKFRTLRTTGDIEDYAERVRDEQLDRTDVPDYSQPIRKLEFARADIAMVRDKLAATGDLDEFQCVSIAGSLNVIVKYGFAPDPAHEAIHHATIDLNSMGDGEYSGDVMVRLFEIEDELAQAQIILQTFYDALDYLEQQGDVTVIDFLGNVGERELVDSTRRLPEGK